MFVIGKFFQSSLTNTLAKYENLQTTDKKSFITLAPGEGSPKAVEELVQTTKGKILVARQGDPKKPVLLTYHDLGLNYLSNFQVRSS